jgi:Homeodomain-like domain
MGSENAVHGQHEHMFAMYEREEVHFALELHAMGLSDYEIARRTGISRSTIIRWRKSPPVRRRHVDAAVWRPSQERPYSYALGVYLGDGHVARVAHPFLRVFLDSRYPVIIGECTEAMSLVFDRPVRRYKHPEHNLVILQLSSPVLSAAFPCGPGLKHLRPIRLKTWQAELVERHPRGLIRGLIHSDGCRCMNRFSTRLPSGRVAHYEYPRYFFTNLSADIRGIFCGACDLVGVRWTQSNYKSISVSHRNSVALLDTFVGPKR